MKRIIILAIILTIVLVGCKPTEDGTGATIENDEVVVIGPSDVEEYEARPPSTPETTEDEGETVVIEEKMLGEKLKALVAKSDKVKSMEYLYGENLEGSHVYVVGTKMKQVFGSKITENNMDYFDVVYLDTVAKTAKAYCEGLRCSVDEKDVAFDVDYDNYITETPLDAINSITYGTVKETQMFENRESAIVERELDDGTIERMWVWTYAGIPLKREFLVDGKRVKRIEYLGLNINDLEESDVTRS